MRRSLTILWGAAAFLGVLNAGPVAVQTRRTVWDGVFTAEQAARGKMIFATTCTACHGSDLSGLSGPALKGEVFSSHWMEGGLDALFARVKSMPPNRANLGDVAYVDLLAFLPSYIDLIIPTGNYFFMIRVLRLLRVFRILKLARYLEESRTLVTALRASRPKITVFLFTVVVIVLVVGTLMYLIEGDENGFDSIPHGIYWAIVTLTTVGYGDITPHTVLGRVLASFIMIMGYGIIAVPTGIFSVELHQAVQMKDARACPNCKTLESDRTARFCRHCGQALG